VSSFGLFGLIVSFAVLAALTTWGFIGAKMQAKPWRMLFLGLVVTVFGAIQQFKLSLPVPAVINSQNAANILVEMREVLTVTVSVLLSMGGALMGSAVSLQAARLFEVESYSIKSALEDAELDIEELQKKIAATPKSDGRDWWVDQLVEATDHLHELESSAEKLGFPKRRRIRRRLNQPISGLPNE